MKGGEGGESEQEREREKVGEREIIQGDLEKREDSGIRETERDTERHREDAIDEWVSKKQTQIHTHI
jgi:hypothetical protein